MTNKEEKKLDKKIKAFNFLYNFLNTPIIEILLALGVSSIFMHIPEGATISGELLSFVGGGFAVCVISHNSIHKSVTKKLTKLEYAKRQIEQEKENSKLLENNKNKELSKELEDKLKIGVTAKSNIGYIEPRPTIESTLYDGEIKDDSIDDWELYLANSNQKSADYNVFLLTCLEELNAGITFDDLFNLIAENISANQVMNFVCLLIEFSPRGEELEKYWNSIFLNHQINGRMLKRKHKGA